MEAGQDKELEEAVRRLGFLKGLARERRRYRSRAWVVAAVIATLLAAVVLRFTRLGRVDVALAAQTRAFLLVNGPSATNILSGGVPVRQLSWKQANWCTEADPARPVTCEAVQALRLNTLYLNPGAQVKVRRAGRCFELHVFDGGARGSTTSLSPAAKGRPTPPGEWYPGQVELGPGDAMSFCPTGEVSLSSEGIVAATIGDRKEGAPAEQRDLAALSKATLTIRDTGQSLELQPTDVLQVGGLSSGVLVARLTDSIELTLVGRAQRVDRMTGSRRDDLMPDRLAWVQGSARLKAVLALLAGIFGAVVAMRDRWLGEIG
jgi:hypothetical protein